jgi:diguanylate cyclase (GGDEF)-like protein
LFNRRKLDEALAQECARAQRTQSPLTVIMADIDKFKSVNDTHGHQVGDQMLIEFAGILQRRVRKVDTVGRWGGEEFLILCPDTNLAGACNVAENIRCSIESYDFPVVGRKTSCFGVAEYRLGEAPEAIIKRADAALYRAKNEGRNRVTLAPA